MSRIIERIKVPLDQDELSGIVQLSEKELRPVPDQIRMIVRDRLREVGILPPVQTLEETGNARIS